MPAWAKILLCVASVGVVVLFVVIFSNSLSWSPFGPTTGGKPWTGKGDLPDGDYCYPILAPKVQSDIGLDGPQRMQVVVMGMEFLGALRAGYHGDMNNAGEWQLRMAESNGAKIRALLREDQKEALRQLRREGKLGPVEAQGEWLLFTPYGLDESQAETHSGRKIDFRTALTNYYTEAQALEELTSPSAAAAALRSKNEKCQDLAAQWLVARGSSAPKDRPEVLAALRPLVGPAAIRRQAWFNKAYVCFWDGSDVDTMIFVLTNTSDIAPGYGVERMIVLAPDKLDQLANAATRVEVRNEAIDAIAAAISRSKGEPMLIRLADSPKKEVRTRAREWLTRIGSKHRLKPYPGEPQPGSFGGPAIADREDALDALRSTDDRRRENAARWFARSKPAERGNLKELLPLIRDLAAGGHGAGFEALSALDKSISEPLLRELAASTNHHVRSQAGSALKKIDPEFLLPGEIPRIPKIETTAQALALLQAKDIHRQKAAVQWLKQYKEEMAPRSAEFRKGLAALLKVEDVWMRQDVQMLFLMVATEDDAPLLRDLATGTPEPSQSTWQRLLPTLMRLDPETGRAIIEARFDDLSFRGNTIWELRKLPSSCESGFWPLLETQNQTVFSETLQILNAIGTDASVPALQKAVRRARQARDTLWAGEVEKTIAKVKARPAPKAP